MDVTVHSLVENNYIMDRVFFLDWGLEMIDISSCDSFVLAESLGIMVSLNAEDRSFSRHFSWKRNWLDIEISWNIKMNPDEIPPPNDTKLVFDRILS